MTASHNATFWHLPKQTLVLLILLLFTKRTMLARSLRPIAAAPALAASARRNVTVVVGNQLNVRATLSHRSRQPRWFP